MKEPATPLPWALRLTKAPQMKDRCLTLGPEVGVVLMSLLLGSPENAALIGADAQYATYAVNAFPGLVDALSSEWEDNHAEHCTNVEHRPGQTCSWPKPDALVRAESPTYDEWPP